MCRAYFPPGPPFSQGKPIHVVSLDMAVEVDTATLPLNLTDRGVSALSGAEGKHAGVELKPFVVEEVHPDQVKALVDAFGLPQVPTVDDLPGASTTAWSPTWWPASGSTGWPAGGCAPPSNARPGCADTWPTCSAWTQSVELWSRNRPNGACPKRQRLHSATLHLPVLAVRPG